MTNFSFIIPAYNEEKYIGTVLDAIQCRADKLNLSFEIIVIDNGSTDETRYHADKRHVQVYTIEKSTVAFARNFGANHAKGDVFCFIDGDTVLTDSWFAALQSINLESLDSNMFVTGAHVTIPKDSTWIERNWFTDIISNNHIGSANLICSSKVFNLIGGFNSSKRTGEDYDFCVRAKSKNIPLHINKDFEAIHLGYPKDLYNFIKRELWHGTGDAENLKSFFRSKVSIVSLFYLITFVLIFLSCFLGIKYFVFLSSVFILINLILTLKLRYTRSFESLLVNNYLNVIYFLSRAISPFYLIYLNRKN